MDFPVDIKPPDGTPPDENEDEPKAKLILRTTHGGNLRIVVAVPVGRGPLAPDGSTTERVFTVGFPR